MSLVVGRQQRLNPFTTGVQVRQRGDQGAVRGGEASSEGGVIHASMVAERAATTPHQTGDEAPTSAYHSTVNLEVAIPLAAARAGYTLGQIAAYMEMDASNLSKVLRGNGHLSLQRLLKAPVAFWREFLPLLAEPAGLAVTHEELAEIALKQTAVALDGLARAVGQLMRRAG